MKIDCKQIVDNIYDRIIEEFNRAGRPRVRLVVVSVGDNVASEVYMRNKQKACARVGFEFLHKHYSSQDTYEVVSNGIKEIHDDPDSITYGIILQLPICSNVITKEQEEKLIQEIPPYLDVDGFSSKASAALYDNYLHHSRWFYPCTALGVVDILKSIPDYELSGKNVLVFGRSNLVGKPLANMLLAHNCTPILAHSKTKNKLKLLWAADIIVTAVGNPETLTDAETSTLSKDKVIIDVGINRDEDGKLCGDVAESLKEEFAYYTSVPGGVGLLTVAELISNVWKSWKILENF